MPETYQITEDCAVYFVTFTIVGWLPIFISEEPCQLITESLNFCHREKFLRIDSYVIMPTHLHAILYDADFNAHRLSQSLAAFRKFTGRQLADYCTKHLPSFDRVLREQSGKDRERKFWQNSRHPEAIISRRFLEQKRTYLHDNPRRKGLVRQAEHWRYSSAAFWTGEVTMREEPVILSPVEE
ncbi:MAG: transposase [Anaerolineae bacterium]|nr:transposase [Anaerolineae bacterium]